MTTRRHERNEALESIERDSMEELTMATKKKTTIAAEAETKLFIQRFRQRLREHSRVWGKEWRRIEKLRQRFEETARAVTRLDNVAIDPDDVAEALNVLLATAKRMDRQNNR